MSNAQVALDMAITARGSSLAIPRSEYVELARQFLEFLEGDNATDAYDRGFDEGYECGRVDEEFDHTFAPEEIAHATANPTDTVHINPQDVNWAFGYGWDDDVQWSWTNMLRDLATVAFSEISEYPSE